MTVVFGFCCRCQANPLSRTTRNLYQVDANLSRKILLIGGMTFHDLSACCQLAIELFDLKDTPDGDAESPKCVSALAFAATVFELRRQLLGLRLENLEKPRKQTFVCWFVLRLFHHTELEHTSKRPLPTGYKGIPFIVG